MADGDGAAGAAAGAAAARPPPPPVINDDQGNPLPGSDSVRLNLTTRVLTWIVDPPEFSLLRINFENEYLRSISTSADQQNTRNLAAGLLRQRIDSPETQAAALKELETKILAKNALLKVGPAPRDILNIPSPDIGQSNTIPDAARKTLVFAAQGKKFSDTHKASLDTILALGSVLTTISSIIQDNGLNERCAYSLTRSVLTGHAHAQSQFLENGRYPYRSFFQDLQLAVRNSFRKEDAVQKLASLLQRPVPSRGFGALITSIEMISRFLVDVDVPEADMIASYRKSVYNSIKSVVSTQFPTQLNEIMSQVENYKLIHEAEQLSLEEGRRTPFDELSAIKRACLQLLTVASDGAARLQFAPLPSYVTNATRDMENQSNRGARPKRQYIAGVSHQGRPPPGLFANVVPPVNHNLARQMTCLRCGKPHKAADCRIYMYCAEQCPHCERQGKRLFHSPQACREHPAQHRPQHNRGGFGYQARGGARPKDRGFAAQTGQNEVRHDPRYPIMAAQPRGAPFPRGGRGRGANGRRKQIGN